MGDAVKNETRLKVIDTRLRPTHRRAGHFVALGLFDSLSSFAHLESRISQLPVHERGDAFEVFAEAYLSTQKLVGAEEVWPADQVPIAVLEACCLPVRDLGADGVYKTWVGQYNAYQAKFRTGRPALTWQELSTFMGLTDQVGGRVLFTNCDDLPAVMDARSGFFCIRGADLERLTNEDLGAIADWLRGAAFKPKRKEPRSHQFEALEAILGGLEEHDRVTAVMACGTGKTLVSLWLAERRQAKRILVLVPSLALIRQTLHEWLKETRWDQPRFIAVCSDPTVSQGVEDVLVVHQRDLDFPVTTDVGEVRDFLATSGDGIQIVFSTYQSPHVVGEGAREIEGFDLGVFDEAHKTTGREGAKFTFALDNRRLKIAKRIFLTATPRHYDVRKRDKEGDKALVYSMDVPATYGRRVHTLTFADAARRGIICNYKIIISVVTSDMINADLLSKGEVMVEGDVVRARTVANQIAIQKACHEHDLKKVFSFHRNVASARDFTGDTASSIKTHLPDYATYHVNGEMRTARREREMRAFREADRAIISNARCLTEGVDVPAVDVVAFLSPRKSKVDIVQAVGRAMRKVDGKEIGYVLLPLFLETQENETIEAALERTDFEEAWDVLQAVQEQDAVLAEIIREMREERGRRGGFDDSSLRERVEVLGPEISLEKLRSAISTALIDQLGITWDERYGELKRYRESFGDCNVPFRWEQNPQLATWVNKQRYLRNEGRLPSERTVRLDALGFVWDIFDFAWEAMFAELKRHKEEHGNCKIPAAYAANPRLGRWVAGLRQKKEALTAAQVERLNALGFIWEPLDIRWEAKFAELRRYKDTAGDCNVPRKKGEHQELGNWVVTQRVRKKEGTLSAEQEARLNTLGFSWFPKGDFWETRFEELKQYRNKYGDCNVPDKWKQNPQLGIWVGVQRAMKKRGKLSSTREAQLEALGFAWGKARKASAGWEAMFTELESYKGRFGDCDVPQKWRENPQLGTWVNTQRFRKKRGRITEDQEACLNAIGFGWIPMDSSWDSMFAELKHYSDKFHHCNVPHLWEENRQLGTWVAVQRRRHIKGNLSADQKARLDALGFVWDRHDSSWDAMFTELKRYKERFGDCNVPHLWEENPRLGYWVNKQRQKKGRLALDRQSRLDEIGFEWKR